MKSIKPNKSINVTRRYIEAELSQNHARRVNFESRLVALFLLLVIILLLIIAVDTTTGMLGMVMFVPIRLIYRIQTREIKVVADKKSVYDPELDMDKIEFSYRVIETRPYKALVEIVELDNPVDRNAHKTIACTENVFELADILNRHNGIVMEVVYADIDN